MSSLIKSLADALAEKRYETARRIGFRILGDSGAPAPEALLLLHDALVALADFHGARRLLESNLAAFGKDAFAATLALAEDLHRLSSESHYRLSDEAARGFSIDEYAAKYRRLAEDRFAEIARMRLTPEQSLQLDRVLLRCRLKAPAAAPTPPEPVPADPPGSSRLLGRIVHPDGAPAARATVTLGLQTAVRHVDPAVHRSHEMHYSPEIGPMRKRTTRTTDSGTFSFDSVPAGIHDYLAVTLDPETHEIPTRFIARTLIVGEGETLDLGDISAAEWTSSPARLIASPHAAEFVGGDALWKKVAEWGMHNPFHYGFRRQLVEFPLPSDLPPDSTLCVRIDPGVPEPFQVVGGRVSVLCELPPLSDRVVAVYAGAGPKRDFPTPLGITEESGTVWRIDTGPASFRIAGPRARASAPILAVRAADGVWRGTGRFTLPEGVAILKQDTRVEEQGPLSLRVMVSYDLSGGGRYSLELQAIAGEPVLLVRETSTAVRGAVFEFSLREFSGGRGFLHWTPENGPRHWTTLGREEKTIAMLPESVPWWIPPQGFGYAMTPDSLDERDYVAVFTVRRGEWIDRAFERIAQGPMDRDGSKNFELDWPFPEMVGSSISMITACTGGDGDVYFRFGLFDGERRWGLLASSLDRNDGPEKEIAALQHAYSSPRLQDFKDWHLDEPDHMVRPHVVADRASLPALRRRSKNPRFAGIWGKIRGGRVPGPAAGLVFAVEGDPEIAWRRRTELLAIAEVRSRMTLLGRDWSDTYSPVGGRPITQWAEEYDLIAASGAFSPDEERLMRTFFILMGHMYMETDFMNWKFNARNANFEADRVDIVASVGLAFKGHADSGKFLDHAVERTRLSLGVYCTEGSGKWYENPACYYLHASKCRMNLIYHLARHGLVDVSAIPRLKEFLRWGVLLLTPPQPVSYAVMRDGGERAFLAAEKIRKVPPIGDHASIGRWLPEHYFLSGKLFSESDPEFGREMIGAYFLSNADGARLLSGHSGVVSQTGEQLFHDVADGSSFGNLPLLFAAIEEEDIPERPHVGLASRRLEGFGAILRKHVNTEREGYVLLKQGPGGYRYHRTEGSFLFFAEGRPLVYDGGEAGETWRHSTLSFHEVCMPLAAGRVERFFSGASFQFIQGIHPEVIAPGRPVFLSDSCGHELVEEAYRRFETPRPAAVRSLTWVDDAYLIVHDSLDICPSIERHWHLQVVADSFQGSQGHFLFRGRFGVDLQVVLPDQTFSNEQVEQVPILEYRGAPADWFSMHHLRLTGGESGGYSAVLRPLSASSPQPISAGAPTRNLVCVSADGINDYHWLSRNPIRDRRADILFEGMFGARLLHRGKLRLWLGSSGKIQEGGLALESFGPQVLAEIDDRLVRLLISGDGRVCWNGKEVRPRAGGVTCLPR